jgi:hypothetical protein
MKDYSRLTNLSTFLDFNAIRKKVEGIVNTIPLGDDESITAHHYVQLVDRRGLWKTWTDLIPAAYDLHLKLGVIGLSSTHNWVRLLEFCYEDYSSAMEYQRQRESRNLQTEAVNRKISAHADDVEKCTECHGLGRVYAFEDMWATCDCAGGDGLTTDLHYY